MTDTSPRAARIAAAAVAVAVCAPRGALRSCVAALLRSEVPHLELPAVDVRGRSAPTCVERAERYERLLLRALGARAGRARRGRSWSTRGAERVSGGSRRPGRSAPGCCSGWWGSRWPGRVAAPVRPRRRCGGIGATSVSRGRLRSTSWSTGWSSCSSSFVVLCVAAARRDGSWRAGSASRGGLPGAARPRRARGRRRRGLRRRCRTEARRASTTRRSWRATSGSQRRRASSDVPLRHRGVSGDTSQANAYAWGLGGTREIVLWDTLLDGRFDEREVDVVARARARPPLERAPAEGDRLVRARSRCPAPGC